MLAQIFILFALVSAVLSAKNLREVPAVAAVPVDHKRAAAAFQSIMTKSFAAQKSDNSFIKKRTATAAIMDNKPAVLNKKAVQGAGPWRAMTDGYYIVRHRPNADCSGVPTKINARRVHHTCEVFPDNAGSFQGGCTSVGTEKNVVQEVLAYFSSSDCSGEPYAVYEQNHEDQCSLNTDDRNYWYAPDMRGVQCAPDGLQTAIREGGFITYTYERSDQPEHNDHTCQGPPTGFMVHKGGECELQMEPEDEQNPVAESTRYSYVSLAISNGQGEITVKGFSDPACSRPIWSGKAHITQFTNDFNVCVENVEDNDYSRTVYYPPAGHHQ